MARRAWSRPPSLAKTPALVSPHSSLAPPPVASIATPSETPEMTSTSFFLVRKEATRSATPAMFFGAAIRSTLPLPRPRRAPLAFVVTLNATSAEPPASSL